VIIGFIILCAGAFGMGVLTWETLRYTLWQSSVIAWGDEREKIFHQLYQEAEVVCAVPNHASEFALPEGPAGNLVHRSGGLGLSPVQTPLNYQTLKSMFDVMLSQEKARREYTQNLKNTMWRLQQWEKVNPLPERPKYLLPWQS
jgi:hypothetical protein